MKKSIPETTILIVEDDQFVRQSMAVFLENSGFHVLQAANGREGLELFTQKVPDLLLLDLQMPEMSGLDLLAAIKDDLSVIPAIVVSGTGTMDDVIKSLRLGAWDYLTKPIEDLVILEFAVHKALEKAYLIKENRRYQHHLEEEVCQRTAELNQRKQELLQICVNVPFAVCFIDKEMRVIRMNPVMEVLIGFKSEETRGQHCYDCWGQYAGDETRHGQERICDACKVVLTLRDGSNHSYERKMDDKIIEIISTPVRDMNGNIIGAMEVATDITERKKNADKIAQHHQQLQQLSSRLIETEEKERRRIARELHDQIGQQLTALGINLHIMEHSVPPEQRKRIDDSFELIKTMTGKVRDIMADLRPLILDDYGLGPALQWYGSVFAKRTGLTVIVLAEPPRLSANLEITLFRITQEALNNVIKHSQATKVEIRCALEDKLLSLAIEDNGCGMQDKAPESQTWGLLSMHERIETLGGKLIVASRPGLGTVITVKVQI
ncbi:MAG: response regulator [Pseudomonadota bacterium]